MQGHLSVDTIPPKLEPLIEEARKYKNAEEFIKTQPNYYRGVQKDSYKRHDYDYFTADRDYAQYFAGKKGKVTEVFVYIKNPYGITAKYMGYGEIVIDGKIIGFYRELKPETVTILKSKGYDGILVDYPYKDKRDFEVVPFDKSQVFTKEQLIDFYNIVTKKSHLKE